MRNWTPILTALVLLCCCVSPVYAQTAENPAQAPAFGTPGPQPGVLPALPGQNPQQDPQQAAQDPNGKATLTLSMPGGRKESLGSAIEIVLLMTLLSLAPAIVMTMTCFTRIIIVLSFLRRAMSMQDLPPTMVVTGFAVFMSIFVMAPVIHDIKGKAYDPYVAGKISFEDAAGAASERMKEFMGRQTRTEDLELIHSLADPKDTRLLDLSNVPFYEMVPAFILSEIKTAFQMGFVLFLPFVIIDLVISSILVSMGMFTLPPVVVSTPLKLLLFVLVDGWNLVVRSLADSFMTIT